MSERDRALVVGIDTGGTFTDAVLFAPDTETVLASAKAPTDHDALERGVEAALDDILGVGVQPGAVGLVCLSSTLATNALVENKGRRACLVSIGFDEAALARAGLTEAIRDDAVVYCAGGHTSHGDERAPLDVADLLGKVRNVADGVDAFAVTAEFSVRNASHEEAARRAIREATGRPVTCSHELSEKLNGPKRALTTLLNARLVAMIDELLSAVRTTLSSRAIDAPLMVVRGDGSLVSAELVAERPIETILSGPAASLVGAAHLVDATDALVVDIGGTTTDIAVINDGRPFFGREGAVVGGHATMIEAVQIRTHGLGGDSEVRLSDEGALEIGPRRVRPVSSLAVHHREIVLSALERQLRADRVSDLDGCFAWRAAGGAASPGRRATALLDELGDEVRPLADVVTSGVERRAMSRLVDRGLVRLAAMTPTDAAHVAGLQRSYDAEAAHLAAGLFSRRRDRFGNSVAADATSLAERVVDRVVRESSERLLESAFLLDGLASEEVRADVTQAALDGHPSWTQPSISLRHPVVALGAPAATYYPAVGRMLATTVLLPDHAEVANALGAAVGRVRVRREAIVSAPRRGVYRVHLGGEPETFYDVDAARRRALDVLVSGARDDAIRAGAVDVDTTASWHVTGATIDDREVFVEGRATVVATGRPAVT